MQSHEAKARFIEPMLLQRVSSLPEGPEWAYEIKLDGYRALAINADGKRKLFSRNRKSFDYQYLYIVDALANLPEDTVVDGEIVALDDSGRSDFVRELYDLAAEFPTNQLGVVSRLGVREALLLGSIWR